MGFICGVKGFDGGFVVIIWLYIYSLYNMFLWGFLKDILGIIFLLKVHMQLQVGVEVAQTSKGWQWTH